MLACSSSHLDSNATASIHCSVASGKKVQWFIDMVVVFLKEEFNKGQDYHPILEPSC